MTSPASLRRRLATQLIGSAAILAAVLILLFLSFSRQIAQNSQDNILLASATSILENISVRNDEIVVDIPYSAFSMLGSVSNDRVFYRIDNDDELLTGYSDLPRPDIQAATNAFATRSYLDADIRTVSALKVIAVNQRIETVIVTIAQTQEGLTDQLNALFKQALGIGVGFFIISSILAIIAVNRVFRPLQDLATSVSGRGPNDLEPFNTAVPDEMVPLVHALNSFTGRLDRSLSRSEDFITEAAHRVRTPLATVRTQAEVFLRRVRQDNNRTTLKDMIRAIDESSRAAGQLIDQAMVNLRTDVLDRKEVNLGECIVDAVQRLQPIASLRDIDLKLAPMDVHFAHIDPILIQNAITNIVDNAIKYSPPETEISVQIISESDKIIIRILDQGPGFCQDDPRTLLGRFVRGQSSTDKIGSGLGLTIANDVFIAHGGGLRLYNRQEGTGACVEAFLPR
ncbi:sensor histidine kinase [Parasulfitobacter algicola]|uniref:histidine kinase n=1 Tax=Parasulfitobacter algicola TaxID=2614809 RepID=A0ABX2ITY2_9RHOB|nr:sensor histidine kinase [Sulfitobacter algicola]NSX53498.1 sensor histidine kinase [Sulfitobacter algicola]